MSFRQGGILNPGSTITISDNNETTILTVISFEGMCRLCLPTMVKYKVLVTEVDTLKEPYEQTNYFEDSMLGRG